MQRKRADLETPEELLKHISPLGWQHILLIGQYIWRKRAEIALFRPLPESTPI